MTIGLVMIVRNEAGTLMLPACVDSVKPLIDHWTIVDTGSTDETPDLVKKLFKGVKGKLHKREFVDFGTNRTQALALARGKTDWLLLLDADMTVDAHPDLLAWLKGDPDPETQAWMVSVVDSGTTWRMPLLIRGDREWRFVGKVHEYLDTSQVKRRPLLGLTVTHHGSSRSGPEKYEQYLDLLAEDLAAGDPRAVFYSAECYRFMGQPEKAVELYRERAKLPAFEEEAWYAEYQAAKLTDDIAALYRAWERRPHRHEPLKAAADIVRQKEHDDILFVELG